mmetsp:Transcript_12228/g.20874  ORF Transcript_12228/g.20874 Transcript_12228/m.20874 type:complete len:259 (+) Transcript_12228:272-1048(+)
MRLQALAHHKRPIPFSARCEHSTGRYFRMRGKLKCFNIRATVVSLQISGRFLRLLLHFPILKLAEYIFSFDRLPRGLNYFVYHDVILAFLRVGHGRPSGLGKNGTLQTKFGCISARPYSNVDVGERAVLENSTRWLHFKLAINDDGTVNLGGRPFPLFTCLLAVKARIGDAITLGSGCTVCGTKVIQSVSDRSIQNRICLKVVYDKVFAILRGAEHYAVGFKRTTSAKICLMNPHPGWQDQSSRIAAGYACSKHTAIR